MAVMIVLLLLPLALGSKDELQVMQPLWQSVSPSGVAHIRCECTEEDMEDRELEIKLMKINDHQWSCSANKRTSPHCSVQKEGSGVITFTLSHQKPDRHDMYICECTRSWPSPVIRQNGTGTVLVAEIHCPILNFWTWTLIGVAGLFCLCSMFVTCAYIKLRVLQSEETDDSLTYVQMQRKRRDPENNAEYVDMREVYSVGRGSGRDMNYNSQQFHCMSYPSK
ncbi:uncharacterized protein si:ch211-67e16.3 [Brienomyrus brachyistius]|uniref:uncharacterized protein si:ch211-67e16.3 n=1 Tax=Brienomyrus brachyistius TaxID=42636 RepID=UPI0020B267E4|nr:uncharacterized protein si:ch211-67e16.3 [Brienomyrus brachyistius]